MAPSGVVLAHLESSVDSGLLVRYGIPWYGMVWHQVWYSTIQLCILELVEYHQSDIRKMPRHTNYRSTSHGSHLSLTFLFVYLARCGWLTA